ncbi:Ras-related protein Rab-22A [Balamuthia mandrillaris]
MDLRFYPDEAVVEAKMVVLGDCGVGKSSLIIRYVHDEFTEDQATTIGASFMTTKIHVDGLTLKLQIWDTAGQERFRAMTPMYYRGAAAALLVYSITDKESFEAVKSWVKELKNSLGKQFENLTLVIAGNKLDLDKSRQVSTQEAQEYADEIDAVLIETSASTGTGVASVFAELSTRLLRVAKEQGARGEGDRGRGSVWLKAEQSEDGQTSDSKSADRKCCILQ